jgi:hypothetical protein
LWGRSQIVASVLKGGERLYFDPYAETLAQRAEAERKPPEFQERRKSLSSALSATPRFMLLLPSLQSRKPKCRQEH